jgi:Ohr subfamily peroxiredoxin
MSKIEKVLLTGKTHTTVSGNAAPHSHHGRLNLELSSGAGGKPNYVYSAVVPHPTAEQLFAGAWSSCYTAALGVVAEQKQVKLPADLAVDIEVDLGMTGDAFLLQARLTVSLPGLGQDVAEAIAHAADAICPYSKATRGNIDVTLNVVGA